MQELPIEMRVDTKKHRLAYIRGNGNRLVVSMSGVGNRRRFFPPWEFIATASDNGRNHVLLVSDIERSWMNSPILPELIANEIERIKSTEQIDEVVALGNSMGGFMALVLPQYTLLNRIVAISPQFSMHPDIMPEEERWAYWQERIGTFRHEDVGDIDPKKRGYFILHGGTKRENIHWGMFHHIPKLHHYILKGKGHQVIVAMKGSGLMRDVLHLAIVGQEEKAIGVLPKRFNAIRRDQMPEETKFLW